MNIYDEEATQFQNIDNEATRFENTASEPENNEAGTSDVNDNKQGKASKGWKHAAVGAASGILIGGVGTVVMANTHAEGSASGKDTLQHPEWVDGKVDVATSVDEDMSFGEAFDAARAEVGAGGAFEWHGQIYSTYTEDEWNNMTDGERAEYGSHFSWNNIDHSSDNVAQHSATEHNPTAEMHNTTGQHATTAQQHTDNGPGNQTAANDDDIKVISVTHQETPTEQSLAQGNGQYVSNEVDAQPAGNEEIEILGVVHNDELGANTALMKVDGQDVILIDVDNDLTFDYIGADTNGNGQLEQNELQNIQGQHLTVNDLGGFTNPAGDMYAANDVSDDIDNGVYEG